MGQHVWWGGPAGACAGLAMFACAIALADHGQGDCLRPFSILALPFLAHGAAAMDPSALAAGAVFHEAVGALIGLLGVRFLVGRMPRRALPLWILAGGLSMGLVDRAVAALRAPEMPVMLTGTSVLPYLAFGAALAVIIHGFRRLMSTSADAGGLGPPLGATPADPALLGTVIDRPLLDVLIVPHCFGCERARHLAAETQGHFPELAVQVVDLEASQAPLPRGLIAVPAYVLNGRLLFTGNPTAEALRRALTTAGAVSDSLGSE